MSKYKDPDSWRYGGVRRRDFRHTHDGPEIPPHRKTKKKVNKSRCDHRWSDPHISYRYTLSKKLGDQTMLTEYWWETIRCLNCGKREYAAKERSWFAPPPLDRDSLK
jgi:hypothetical protein